MIRRVNIFLILLLGISGLFIPTLVLILFITTYLRNKQMNEQNKLNIISIAFSIVSIIVAIISAGIAYNQARIAKEATIPHLLVSFYYDEQRRGFYVNNAGKGNAIIDKIKINGKEYSIVTKEDWNAIFKEKSININAECLASTPIQSNNVLKSGGMEILIGQRQALWDEIVTMKNESVKIANSTQINKINQLLIQHILNSSNMDNAIATEINDKLNELNNEPNKFKLNHNCQEIDEYTFNKLKDLEIIISYHSIIDETPIESKQLK